jgi:predicted nuclease of predicted toxin-antitoxin system
MRLLLDENLPVSLAGLLHQASGWDVEHVRGLGMKSASDPEVLSRAGGDGRILVSADTDFGTLLAASGASGPSVVLLRIGSGRRPEQLAGLLMANLPPVAEDLAGGAMVVITDQRVRVRRLPIG